MAREALELARLCVQFLPEEPEARGLLALLLYCESRQGARRMDGRYIPLSEQPPERWNLDFVNEAEAVLMGAARWQSLGRFQLEAAIQSMHSQRCFHRPTDWEALVVLYRGLLQVAPTLGAWVGYAAALAETFNAQVGLDHWISCLPSLGRPWRPINPIGPCKPTSCTDWDRRPRPKPPINGPST
ncbi:MAG: hypothetical protein OHK0012_21930 [Synechococcales cyanobacterium]